MKKYENGTFQPRLYDESCVVPMQLDPMSGCTGHGCNARIGDIRFDNQNCCERRTEDYCSLDVTECLFSREPVCLQKELVRGVRVFFMDVHMQKNGHVSCTRWCTIHLMTVEEMLSIFRDFLRINPREVLIPTPTIHPPPPPPPPPLCDVTPRTSFNRS